MLGRFREGFSSGCCRRHNKWYQSQVSLGISGDSEGSKCDSVEIACRSQIRGIGVRVDRVSISEGRKEDSWNLWWSRSGVKLDLGFQGKGKKSNFYLNRDLFPVDCSSS